MTDTISLSLFLSGDVMMGRGIDQLLPWPCEPTLYEEYMASAKDYLALAEAANGLMRHPVDPLYPWGDALKELNDRRPDARIINLETSVTHCARPDRPGVNVLPDLSSRAAAHIGTEIAAKRKAGDLVIVSVHWGGNWGYPVPPAHMAFAHALVDEGGIHLVHGHSSHHPKAIEVYKGQLILYGCGDFITDYEGIAGYESFRDDLVLMYLPALRTSDGMLAP